MKRKIILVAAIIVLLFGALVSLPFLFKDQLLAKAKTTLNDQVNAKIDFSGFSLSLFSHFPKVEMEIKNLCLTGVDEFAKDTIFSAKSVSTDISIAQMISGKGIELKKLWVDQPKVNLLSNKSGKVNWDIAKTSGQTPGQAEAKTSATSGNDFKLKISDIKVNNLNLKYTDEAKPMNVWVKNTNLSSSGDVTGSVTNFDLKGEASEVIFEYQSVKYISKTKLKVEALLNADYNKMIFTLNHGKLSINNLPLEVNGTVAMAPKDSVIFDLGIQSEKSDFSTILSLVPADYQKYIEKADIKGSAEFKGSVKGAFYKETYPALNFNLSAQNASFKYQGLPESVQDIQVSANITKPGGDLNLLKINIDKAHASIRNNPVDFQLQVSEPMTDPNLNASFSGTIDFATLKQAIPIDSLDITGIVKARLQMAGRMSSIEKQEYDQFRSEGEASVQNFRIKSNQLTKPIEIIYGQVKASTKQISIDRFEAKIGPSDFSLKGEVSNYLAYLFKNGTLKGGLNLKSNFLNFSDLSNIRKPVHQAAKTQTATAPSDSAKAFQVPQNLDLSLQSTVQKAVYDQMPISNINGLVKVKDRRIELTNLSMDMLQGKVAVNGSYTSNKENKPVFDFKLDMQNIDFTTAYQSVSTIRRYLPIAAKSQGKFNTQLNLSGAMDEKMNLTPSSLNGQGIFNCRNLMIVDSQIFDQIRGIIKKEKLKNVKVDDFTAKFEFKNGELKLDPFKTSIADQQATIYGTLSATREINMNLDFLVNREDLGTDINKGLSILPGSQNIKMIDASVVLKGPIAKPEVSLDLSKAREEIEKQVKKASSEEIKNSVKKLGNELKKLFK